MEFALMTAPGGIPHDAAAEASSVAKVKAAEARAAQATASTAQVVADEYRKSAEEAQAAAMPVADTGPVSLRAMAHSATESLIETLKKINTPPTPPAP